MADPKKPGMISGMSPLAVITGDELMEVSSRQLDGTWKTFSILINKIRTNEGLSAYEVAVVNGFQGTQTEWLDTLVGKSAYQAAVELGFVGTEEEFIESLMGPSAYAVAVEQGYTGTVTQWLKSLEGQTAYELAVANGYVGTEAAWLNSLKGKSAYQIAKELDPTIGTEAEWLATLVGDSAYQVALDNGFVGTQAAWLKSLEGKSAYQIWVAQGNVGDESAFLLSLKGQDGTNGTNGTDGQSAYELWEAQAGNAGKTEVEFLASLQGQDGTNGTNGTNGDSAFTTWQNQPGNGTGTEADFLATLEGKSAYEVWLDQAGNAGKTEAEFIAAIKGAKGEDGTNGTNGTNGQSTYELWEAQVGNTGKTEAEFLESLEGASAYETYITIPGNEGKTEAEFILSLKGTTGEAGKSAYQSWVDAGNVGNEATFIASLKGADGERGTDGTNGTNGTNGVDGTGVNILETLSQEDFDTIVADNTSAVGDGYIVDKYIHIYNGTSWVRSNSLEGPAGQGLNYLGTWPTGTPLPLDVNYVAGDTYIWGATADKISLWTLSELPTRQWIDVGVPGPVGKSAYQSWVSMPGNEGKNEAEFVASLNGKDAYQTWLELPGNSGKTEAEFIDSIKGDQGIQGPIGPDGDSAYQIWLDAGNTGDQTAFLAALKGAKGDAAVAFEIMGQLTNTTELPRPGEPTQAYYVGKDLYVWIVADNDYQNLGSLNGASAYQIWIDLGNAGTEQDFINSLKGTDGTNGTDGTDGANLKVIGRLANEAAIQALPTPAEQDAYIADDTGHLWIYNNAAWFDAGKFGGDDGIDGTNGKSAYELWEEQAGNVGKTEAEFLTSLKGTDGADGSDLDLRGTKADAAEIQAIASPTKQEAWVADDTGHLFIYNGSAWVDVGEFRGADGTNGTNGINGKSAFQTYQELPGNSGKTEAEFIASLKGEDGLSINPKGTVENQAALAAIVTPAVNDAYTTLDTGILYVYNGSGWTDMGSMRGAQGVKGDQGYGLNVVAEFATFAERPDPSTYSPGDAVYIEEDGKLYQINEAGLYNPGISIRGEPGEQGIQGIQGPVGASIQIMGSYATLGDLQTAHPTGNPGEGYLIGANLFVYGVNPVGGGTEWYDLGPVRGPQGPIGNDGPRGLRGLIGPTGERGSLWLTLEAGVSVPASNYGRQGDWAVTETFDTYYKSDDTTWVPIGRLVAGDVNSPNIGLGKVVREGNQWVPLPVDAVPSPVEGTKYVMVGLAGGETEWTELVIPASGIPEVPADTTIPQGRTSAGWTAVIAVPTGQTAGKNYVWKDGAFALGPIQTTAPGTVDKPLCYQVNASGVGSWVPVSFDAYSLKMDTSAQTASFTPNFNNQQSFRVSATAGAAVTISLPAFTTGRSLLAVFVVEGATNKALFAATGGGSTVAYNNGVQAADIEYGASQTVITAFWNGFGTWIISKGPAF
jgi:hypothetical protein